MKRVLCLLMVCILAILLCACAPEGYVPVIGATPTPAVTPSPSPKPTATPTATPMPTPVPTPTPAPTPENVPMFTEFIEPGEDTVIIANSRGLIIGGYSDGVWLSHSQAAAYCGGRMTFYERSMDGFKDTIKSIGLIMDNGGGLEIGSGTASLGDRTDYNDFMLLDTDLPEAEQAHTDSVLYYCQQDRFPKIQKVTDTTQFLLIVQGILDEEFGAGTVAAQISDAYSVDLDGDGTTETIVNACNNENHDFENNISGYWYSIAFIVEESGAICEIQQQCWNGYVEDIEFVCVRGVLDVNGDGVYELIVEREGYEWWLVDVIQYDGQNFWPVISFSMGS